MSWILIGAVIAIGLTLSAFFSGAETGLYCVNRLRLQLGVKKHDPTALRLSRVFADQQGALSVTLIGTNLMNYVTTGAVAYLFAELAGLDETVTELYTVLALTPIMFVFAEVVPKNLFRLHADTLLARGSRLLALSDRLFRLTGMVWCLSRLAGVINRLCGGRAPGGGGSAPKRRVAVLLQEALAGHTLGEDQSDLIERVCRISDTPIHAVMVPRNRVLAVSARSDRRQLVRVARRKGHSYLPVHDENRRHVIGLVRVDELLQSEDWTTVEERLHPVTTLSPHESVATALARLQKVRRSLAIVTDHGGQMLGIVTITDLLGEIVGELSTDD